jgi:hypothetical protein
MRRCDCHSGVSIGAALHRCRKGHPEVFRNDRKTGGTSTVPEQRRRTSDLDADLRQWMRDHRRQRPVCRGCSRGSVTRSTGTGVENFTISDAAGEMTGHGTSPRKCDLSVLLPAAGARSPKSDRTQPNGGGSGRSFQIECFCFAASEASICAPCAVVPTIK